LRVIEGLSCEASAFPFAVFDLRLLDWQPKALLPLAVFNAYNWTHARPGGRFVRLLFCPAPSFGPLS
jgi:hypothetical protein